MMHTLSLSFFVSLMENPECGCQESDCQDHPGLVSLDVTKKNRHGYAKDITTDSQQGGVNGSAQGIEKQEFGGLNPAGAEHYEADGSNSIEKAESDDEQAVILFEELLDLGDLGFPGSPFLQQRSALEASQGKIEEIGGQTSGESHKNDLRQLEISPVSHKPPQNKYYLPLEEASYKHCQITVGFNVGNKIHTHTLL
jgi:hypothetical protein